MTLRLPELFQRYNLDPQEPSFYKPIIKAHIANNLINDPKIMEIRSKLGNYSDFCYLTGGACLSYLHEESPKDYDILCTDFHRVVNHLGFTPYETRTDFYRTSSVLKSSILLESGESKIDLIRKNFDLFNYLGVKPFNTLYEFTFNSVYINLKTLEVNLNAWSMKNRYISGCKDISEERLQHILNKTERYGYQIDFGNLNSGLLLKVLNS